MKLVDQVAGYIITSGGKRLRPLIVLVAAHIYFAIRPEKRWMTWSMILGWVDREHYLAHHDPEKWVVSGDSVTSGETGAGALADSSVSAPREED